MNVPWTDIAECRAAIGRIHRKYQQDRWITYTAQAAVASAALASVLGLFGAFTSTKLYYPWALVAVGCAGLGVNMAVFAAQPVTRRLHEFIIEILHQWLDDLQHAGAEIERLENECAVLHARLAKYEHREDDHEVHSPG